MSTSDPAFAPSRTAFATYKKPARPPAHRVFGWRKTGRRCGMHGVGKNHEGKQGALGNVSIRLCGVRRDAVRYDAVICHKMRLDAIRCDAMRCHKMRRDNMRCDKMRCDARRRKDIGFDERNPRAINQTRKTVRGPVKALLSRRRRRKPTENGVSTGAPFSKLIVHAFPDGFPRGFPLVFFSCSMYALSLLLFCYFHAFLDGFPTGFPLLFYFRFSFT